MAVLVAVTVAPWTTAPEGSVTTPVIEPEPPIWAGADAVRAKRRTATREAAATRPIRRVSLIAELVRWKTAAEICGPMLPPRRPVPARVPMCYRHLRRETTPSPSLRPASRANTALYPNYTFGNVARTKPYGLRGPTANDLDMELQKTTRISERWNAIFNATVINATNVVVWGPPQSNVGTPSTFGQVTSVANNSRDIQLGLRIQY